MRAKCIFSCLLLFLLTSLLWTIPHYASAKILFERKSWSSTQKSIEATFHLAMNPGMRAQISARWTALDEGPLRLAGYRILGPGGQVVKEYAQDQAEGSLPFGFQQRSDRTRSAETEDWSTKEHSPRKASDGVGWSMPLGKIPEPGEEGTNTDVTACVLQDIEFTMPEGHKDLSGFRLECILYRGGAEPSVVLNYPLD